LIIIIHYFLTFVYIAYRILQLNAFYSFCFISMQHVHLINAIKYLLLILTYLVLFCSAELTSDLFLFQFFLLCKVKFQFQL